jgi:hypothetical protein
MGEGDTHPVPLKVPQRGGWANQLSLKNSSRTLDILPRIDILKASIKKGNEMDAPRCTICGQYGQLGPGNCWVHIDQYHGGSDYDHRFVVAQSSEWEFLR